MDHCVMIDEIITWRINLNNASKSALPTCLISSQFAFSVDFVKNIRYLVASPDSVIEIALEYGNCMW